MALSTRQLAELRHAAVGDTGNRLNAARRIAKLTQIDVAEGTGFTQPYVSAVDSGKHATITVDNARKFAVFFGCSIEDLFPAKSEVA